MPTITYRQLITKFPDWGEVQTHQDGRLAAGVTFDQLNHGALAQIIRVLSASAGHLHALARDTANLRSLVREAVVSKAAAKPESPAEAKEKREAASRERAWAAYVKAGGTMPAGEEGVGGPEPVGIDYTPYVPYVGGKLRRAMEQLGIDTTAAGCMRRLAGFTAAAFGRCEGIGPLTVQKVRAELKAHGLDFKPEE